MSEHNRPHIDITALAQRRAFKSPGSNARQRALNRVRADHGLRLIAEIGNAFAEAEAGQRGLPEQPAGLEPAAGVFIEVELNRAANATNLERQREGTRQAAEIVDENGVRRIALFVPDDMRDAFAQVFEDYTNGELSEKGSPPKKTRVEPIEHIRAARLQSFWRDVPEALPEDPQAQMWWALWCFNDRTDRVLASAAMLGLHVGNPDTFLRFPETTVIPAYGRRASVEMLLFATAGISELRRASDSPLVFTRDLKEDVPAFIDDLAERVTWPGNDAPAVCLLDTGVNRAHPLIEPALSPEDLMAIDTDWGGDDHEHGAGHGTGMAGLALHGDLVGPLAGNQPIQLKHRLESVKILPPPDLPDNDPHSYGPITQSAILLAEINNPDRDRVFCMAVTNEGRSGSDATAWSAAIDQAAAGAESDDPENPPPRRLVLLSAGNIPDNSAAAEIADADVFPAEDPSQAWNALTIGGYTEKTGIGEAGYDTWSPMAPVGAASPYSRTSFLWDTSQSPFKPELVFEAGNRALSPSGTEAVAGLDSLSLLTASRLVDQKPLDAFWATSAATAQAARMAAQLTAAYPQYWPETIRALMVHSARWTGHMGQLVAQCATKRDKADCLRRFGYGVPDLGRAMASAVDDLALVAQNTIRPFRMEGGSVRFNESHIYQLPWPRDVLEQLDNTRVRLKVALSYFVEPNPSFATNLDPARYQSFGLRFDLKRSRETLGNFNRRNNAEGYDRNAPRAANEINDGWLFGERQISSGSLHVDIWEGPAVELAARNALYVHPISGWWRERKSLGRYDKEARYALVVSLETPTVEVDLYTPVAALVPLLVDVPIEF
ncbi:S8 family peptidase [Rhizorhabdus dicambivorans]|uniref:Peptidase S8 family protein n=1 Tax=Rhizorhabdus dicambivorans TaxID=1850238 RepID=A0A2A4FXY2_9SPHN|nr:S8 family peptidase [Rhizorhabdus dicambivorans]ATE66869.1 peptidase S8 family protein [Rhizorhabdus dicambivorans]PCE42263.1 peptidase S8 family protein [Rhizorhabdus dicambivorans]